MIILLLLTQVDSLTLDQMIDLTLINSPIYNESKISLEKSRIQFYQTFANLLPTFNATSQYTKSEYSGFTTSAYTGSLNLNMPIFDIDIISSIMVAGRQLESSNIQNHADISNLLLRLKTAYYNLINAKDLLEASDIAIDRARENLKLAETKFELGAASRLELLQGEVFYLRAQQDKSKAKTLEITAQEEIKSILGIKNDIYPTDTLIDPDSTEILALDSLIAILRKVNYNIRLAHEARNISKLNLISSYLDFLPKISFFYGYSFISDSLIFDFQYYRDNATKNYGISVNLPIFEIKSLIFNCLKAKKEFQLRDFAKKRIILETEKALRTTYYSLRESSDNVRLAKKGFDAATEAATIAREQYALGAISFLDFLSAEKDIYDARVSYTSALTNFYIQQANFSYLLGTVSLNEEQK